MMYLVEAHLQRQSSMKVTREQWETDGELYFNGYRVSV